MMDFQKRKEMWFSRFKEFLLSIQKKVFKERRNIGRQAKNNKQPSVITRKHECDKNKYLY